MPIASSSRSVNQKNGQHVQRLPSRKLSAVAMLALGLLGVDQVSAMSLLSPAAGSSAPDVLQALHAALVRAGLTPEQAQTRLEQALSTDTPAGEQLALARLAALVDQVAGRLQLAGLPASELAVLMDRVAAELLAQSKALDLGSDAVLTGLVQDTAGLASRDVVAVVEAVREQSTQLLDLLQSSAEAEPIELAQVADVVNAPVSDAGNGLPPVGLPDAAPAGAAPAPTLQLNWTPEQIGLGLLGLVVVGGGLGGGGGGANVPIGPADIVPPTATIAENNADGVVSDADQTVTYTVTFSEAVRGLTAADLDIAGGTLVANSITLAQDKLSATFQVKAADDSTANLVVGLKATVLDISVWQ